MATDEPERADPGCPEVVDDLVAQHYDTLKSLARSKRRHSRSGPDLLTTDLLHESWIKLRGANRWNDETHFLRTAATAMRCVLIDHARAKLSQRRGSGAQHLPFDEIAEEISPLPDTPEQVVMIGDLMQKLGEENERFVQVVDLRYFGGFTETETAEILGVTDRTVRRDWQLARAWLASHLGETSAS